MDSLQHFYYKTVKYDLVNKFLIKKSDKIPKVEKIVLNMYCRTKPGDFSIIAACVLALEIIANQSGVLTEALFPHIALRLRRGFPIGCKLTIKKENTYNFLSRVVQEVYPSSKVCHTFKPNKANKAFSLTIKELFIFSELEKQYNLFKDLNDLNITIVTANTLSNQELEFLLTSLKIPITENGTTLIT